MKHSRIRPSRMQDLTAIKQIIEATDLFPSEHLDEMFAADPDPQTGTLTGQAFWLSYDDDGVHAVVYCAPEEMTNGTWNVLLIAVHPDHQDSGIGRMMMSFVEETLRTISARVLLVETSGTDHFIRTRSFYEHIGYTEEARIREYYDAGDDKIVFRKML